MVVGLSLISVVSVSELLACSASITPVVVTTAVLDAVPVLSALTTIVTVAVTAAFTWPRSQVTTLPERLQVPLDGVADL